jgi:hypothetical protein
MCCASPIAADVCVVQVLQLLVCVVQALQLLMCVVQAPQLLVCVLCKPYSYWCVLCKSYSSWCVLRKPYSCWCVLCMPYSCWCVLCKPYSCWCVCCASLTAADVCCKPYSCWCCLLQTSFVAKWRVRTTLCRSSATPTHASPCTPPVTGGRSTRASSARSHRVFLKKVSTSLQQSPSCAPGHWVLCSPPPATRMAIAQVVRILPVGGSVNSRVLMCMESAHLCQSLESDQTRSWWQTGLGLLFIPWR